ncbi:MAG: right-handed parallel beta-helix repeat-containing protein, partial [Gammaproteobacteria bacterium]|nr:right-handed parallel beta-helix repeat-containing protein [Gammaproteobacteria bacterium]
NPSFNTYINCLDGSQTVLQYCDLSELGNAAGVTTGIYFLNIDTNIALEGFRVAYSNFHDSYRIHAVQARYCWSAQSVESGYVGGIHYNTMWNNELTIQYSGDAYCNDVNNNTIYDSTGGIYFSLGSIASYDQNIKNNTLYNIGTNWLGAIYYNNADNSRINLTEINGNTVYDCGRSGIYAPGYTPASNGNRTDIQDNICYNNAEYGIWVGSANHINNGGYKTMVNGNTCYNNGGDGIRWTPIASRWNYYATVNYNECYDNGGSGIYLSNGLWRPWFYINGNECYRNTNDGILFNPSNVANNGGYINNNTCYDNGQQGIEIHGSQENNMYVQGNTCFRNGSDGIYHISNNWGRTHYVDNNTCYENKGSGMYLQQSAYWRLSGNECYGNANDGVGHYQTSASWVGLIKIIGDKYYSNNIGLRLESLVGDTLFRNCEFGVDGENRTADLHLYRRQNYFLQAYFENTIFASAKEVYWDEPVNFPADTWVISLKHDGVLGRTKIWGDYNLASVYETSSIPIGSGWLKNSGESYPDPDGFGPLVGSEDTWVQKVVQFGKGSGLNSGRSRLDVNSADTITIDGFNATNSTILEGLAD